MKKAESEHLSRVAAIRCVICAQPAEIHHLTGAGMGRKSSHYESFGLCAAHHRTGGYGIAIHDGVKEWERNYGTQREFLARVMDILCAEYPDVYGGKNELDEKN